LVPAAEVEAYRSAQARADAAVKEIEADIARLVDPVRKRVFHEKLTSLPEEPRRAYAVPAGSRSGEDKAAAEKAEKQAAPTGEELEKALDAELKEKRSE